MTFGIYTMSDLLPLLLYTSLYITGCLSLSISLILIGVVGICHFDVTTHFACTFAFCLLLGYAMPYITYSMYFSMCLLLAVLCCLCLVLCMGSSWVICTYLLPSQTFGISAPTVLHSASLPFSFPNPICWLPFLLLF